MDADTDSLCVICQSETAPTPDDCSPHYFHPGHPKLLAKDLANYFLLRHIFNLRRERLQDYLRFCPVPRDWVKVCSGCTGNYVEKCRRIFLELWEVKRKFRAARQEIIEAVKKSLSVENEPEYRHVLNIGDEVRRLVCRQESDRDHSEDDVPAPKWGETSKQLENPCDYQSMLPQKYDGIQPEVEVVIKEELQGDFPFEEGGDEFDADVKIFGNEIIEAESSQALFEDASGSEDDFNPDRDDNEDNSCASSTQPQDRVILSPNRRKRTQPTSDSCNSTKPKKLDSFGNTIDPSRKYLCPKEDCGKYFRTKRNLRLHKRKDHPRRKNLNNTCDFCGKFFRFHSSFKRHQLMYSDRPGACSILRCDMCGFEFPQTEHQNMLDHVRGHVGDYAIKCPNEPCPYAFSSSKLIQQHLNDKCRFNTETTARDKEKASSAHLHTCETCKFQTDKWSVLEAHLEEKHERLLSNSSEDYTCPIADCEASFSYRQSVDVHLSTHLFGKTTIQKCELCPSRMKAEALKQHLTDCHKIQEIMHCPLCPLVFATRAYMVEHMNVHRSVGLCCDICGKEVTFRNHQSLRKHYEREHQVDFPRLTCPVCDKTMSTRESLDRHLKRAHGVGDPEDTTPANSKKKARDKGNPIKYTCDICHDPPFVTTTKSTLEAHKVRQHGWKPIQCKTCGLQLSSTIGLATHEKRQHFGVRERPCPAPGCGKVFNTELKLKVHFQASHDEKKHVCADCGKSFSQGHILRNHHNIVHLKRKPHECEVCGKFFATMAGLRLHQSVHTGVRVRKPSKNEKKHVCSECGKCFRSPGGLEQHHNFVHAGIKPYVCDICGNPYVTKEGLRAHKMKHAGEFPHQCSTCGQGYRCSRSFRKHLLLHAEQEAASRALEGSGAETSSLEENREEKRSS